MAYMRYRTPVTSLDPQFIEDILHDPLAMLVNTAFGEPRYAVWGMQSPAASRLYSHEVMPAEVDVAGLLDIFIERPAELEACVGESFTRMRACARLIKRCLDESDAECSAKGAAGGGDVPNDEKRELESVLQLLRDIEHAGVMLTPNTCAAKAGLEYDLSSQSEGPRECGPHMIDQEEALVVRVFTSGNGM